MVGSGGASCDARPARPPADLPIDAPAHLRRLPPDRSQGSGSCRSSTARATSPSGSARSCWLAALTTAWRCRCRPSFQEDVEAAIEQLPTISVVAQLDVDSDGDRRRRPARRRLDRVFSYVPIDPCQPVIAALRLAMGERMTRLSSTWRRPRFEASTAHFPDAYALKKVSPEAFAAAVLPASCPPIGRPARPADRLDGRIGSASLEARHRRSCWSARSPTGPGSATPIIARSRSRSRPRSSRRCMTLGVDPKTLVFLTRRVALPDGSLRARPERADPGRQPVGRWRQGDGPPRPRHPPRAAAQGRRRG